MPLPPTNIGYKLRLKLIAQSEMKCSSIWTRNLYRPFPLFLMVGCVSVVLTILNNFHWSWVCKDMNIFEEGQLISFGGIRHVGSLGICTRYCRPFEHHLTNVNIDIINLTTIGKKIAWQSIRVQSIHLCFFMGTGCTKQQLQNGWAHTTHCAMQCLGYVSM